jgi:exosortase E/protease (VPEID-CTERM system)
MQNWLIRLMSTGEPGPENRQTAMGLIGDAAALRGSIRLCGLVVLLLGEVLALTLRFDGQSIQDAARGLSEAIGPVASDALQIGGAGPREDWMIALVGRSGVTLAIGIAAASATLLFGGPRLRQGLGRAIQSPPTGWTRIILVGHFATLGIFWWLTARLFEGGALVSSRAAGWVLIWGMMGLGVVLSLAATVLPPVSWGILAPHALRPVAVGLSVAMAAMVVGLLARRLWMPLGRWTLEAVHGLLGLTSTEVLYEPSRSLIGTESFAVEIAPQCSGYEGIGLVWAFLGAYLWLCRGRLRFPRAWLLLPLGTAAIWLANVVRITALILIGTRLSADIAAGGFHSQAGWIAFNAVALGLVLMARRCRFFHRDDDARPDLTGGPSREAVYLAPLLAIAAATMACGAFSTGGLDRYYPARLAAVALPLWLYRREYAAMRWTCSWHALAIGILVFSVWVARWPEAAGGSAERSMMALDGGIVGTSAWLLARVIGSVATVPLVEELAFRGFLTRRLIAADFDSVPPGRFTWASFAVSSVAFGVLHDRWLEGTVAGMFYALAYYRRGSLGDAVAAHATTNAMLCADALMTGDWSLFS